jgi:hypothetical protein
LAQPLAEGDDAAICDGGGVVNRWRWRAACWIVLRGGVSSIAIERRIPSELSL